MSKFLRLPEVLARVGLSRSTVYSRIQDRRFPAPLKLGERISVWDEKIVEAWQDEQRERARAERARAEDESAGAA